MWQQRNEALHENPDNRTQILETETNQQVEELQALGPSAFDHGKSLLKHPLSELLQLPHTYKKHWVETAKLAKAWQERRTAGPYHSERRTMRWWLTMVNRAAN